MSRKREPVAEIGDEDYRIVKHTHDVDLAARLMRDRMREEHLAYMGAYATDEDRAYVPEVGKGRQVYVRIQGALPNSYAADEGWSYAYHEYDQPGRGAFPAVVFS